MTDMIKAIFRCEHMRDRPTANGWHWHRGKKVQCAGGRNVTLRRATLKDHKEIILRRWDADGREPALWVGVEVGNDN